MGTSTRRQTYGAEADRTKAREYRDQAKAHDKERKRIQLQLTRAVKHPCTEYTYEASGANVGESPFQYPRAICTALGWLGMDEQTARRLVNVGGVGKGKVRSKYAFLLYCGLVLVSRHPASDITALYM